MCVTRPSNSFVYHSLRNIFVVFFLAKPRHFDLKILTSVDCMSGTGQVTFDNRKE